MGRIGRAVTAGMIGLVLGYGAALGLGTVLMEAFEVSQAEGAAAMGLVFFIAPAAAVLIALASATAAAMLTRR